MAELSEGGPVMRSTPEEMPSVYGRVEGTSSDLDATLRHDQTQEQSKDRSRPKPSGRSPHMKELRKIRQAEKLRFSDLYPSRSLLTSKAGAQAAKIEPTKSL